MTDENIPSDKIEACVLNVEHALRLLTELLQKSYQRTNLFEAAFYNLTVKMEALAHAQIQTELKLTKLRLRFPFL
jgi:hypothetical protein